MPKNVIFCNDQREISYEGSPPNRNFYSRQKKQSDHSFPGSYEKVKLPFYVELHNLKRNEIKKEHIQISIVSREEEPAFYCRKDEKYWVLSSLGALNETNGDKLPEGYFAHFDQRDSAHENPLPHQENAEERKNSFPDSLLSNGQKSMLDIMLFGEAQGGPLRELKANCTSPKQYQDCLHFLISKNKADKPDDLSDKANDAINDFENLLQRRRLHEMKLNSGQNYGGHIATIGEAEQHVRLILEKELKQHDRAYSLPQERVSKNKSELCWPGEYVGDNVQQHVPQWGDDPQLAVVEQEHLSLLQSKQPIFEQQIPHSTQQKTKELLDAITAVQKPGQLALKEEDITASNLKNAIIALEDLCKSDALNPELTNYIEPFLSAMSSMVKKPKFTFSLLVKNFLIPLRDIVAEKLSEQLDEVVEEGVQAKQNLTSAGFRTKFNEWIKGAGGVEFTEKRDERGGNFTLLCGTLPTSGAKIIIHSDKIVLAPELTGDEFEKAIKEIITMYKSAYSPGSPPPLAPLGTDAQKVIIRRLLQEENVPILTQQPQPQETPETSSSSLQMPPDTRTSSNM